MADSPPLIQNSGMKPMHTFVAAKGIAISVNKELHGFLETPLKTTKKMASALQSVSSPYSSVSNNVLIWQMIAEVPNLTGKVALVTGTK